MNMYVVLVISSVQSNLLLKNVFNDFFPLALISFRILQVRVVGYVFQLLK